MAFTDSFDRANANLEASPTASGGGDWVHDGLIAAGLQITGNALRGNTANTTGTAYKTPNQGSADHYVQYRVPATGLSSGPFACCRLTDRSNFVGVRVDGTTIEVYRRVGGSLSNLFTGSSVAANDILRLECSGTTFTVKRNGTIITGPTAIGNGTLTSSDTGIVARSTTGTFFDDFEAGPLAAGGDSTTNATGQQVVVGIGIVSVTAGAPATTFADTFNRADGWLEEAPCKTASGGWDWLWDSAIIHGLSVFNNILYAGVTDSVGSAYKTPSVGSANHYVECIVPAGLAGSISHAGAQSFVCCRLADRSNFVGFHVGDEGAGAGQVVVARRVAGTFTTLYTAGAGAVATGDLLRLECDGSNWTLKKDGVTLQSGAIGAALNDVGTGIVGRGFIGEVAEDFEAGPLATFADPLFYDDFNRADGALEGTPISSSGGAWVHDGRFAGLAINSNQLRSTSTDESGSAYKCNPSPGVLDHFVEFTAIGEDLIYGPGACCRMPDHNQFVGLFHGATTAINFGHVEVWRETAGLASIVQLYNSGDGGYSDGDVLRLAAVGSDWYVFKNGSLMATGAIGATLPSTDAGIIGGGSIGNFFDDFVTGPQTIAALTGQSATVSVGSVLVNLGNGATAPVTGQELVASVGSVETYNEVFVSVEVQGLVLEATVLVGDVTLEFDYAFEVTGSQIEISTGTIRYHSEEFSWNDITDVPNNSLSNYDKTLTSIAPNKASVQSDKRHGGPAEVGIEFYVEVTFRGGRPTGHLSLYNLYLILQDGILRDGGRTSEDTQFVHLFPPISDGDVIGISYKPPFVRFRLNGWAWNSGSEIEWFETWDANNPFGISVDIANNLNNITATINTGDTPFANPRPPLSFPWADGATHINVSVTGQSMTVSGGSVAALVQSAYGWDYTTDDPNGSLTNEDKTLFGAGASAFSTQYRGNGRFYVEVTIGGVGAVNSLGYTALWNPAFDNEDVGFDHNTGDIAGQGTTLATGLFPPIEENDVIGIAYNGVNGQIQFRLNGSEFDNGNPPPWTPNAISPYLWLWIKGDTLPGADGAAIDVVPDSALGGHNLTKMFATGPVKRAGVLNGMSVLEFNNSAVKSAASKSFDDVAIYAVVKGMDGVNTRLVDNNLATGFYVGTGLSANQFGGGFFNNSHFAGGLDDTRWFILVFERTGTVNFASRDAGLATITSVVSDNPTTASPIVVGGDQIGSQPLYDTQIAELLIVDGAASRSLRDRIEGYLAWKWGLVTITNMPQSHPYYRDPPSGFFMRYDIEHAVYSYLEPSDITATINTGDTPFQTAVPPKYAPWSSPDTDVFIINVDPAPPTRCIVLTNPATVRTTVRVFVTGQQLTVSAGNISTKDDQAFVTGSQLTVSVGPVVASRPKIVNLQDAFIYSDNLNRADGNLNAAPASGGWLWSHDGLVAGAMTVSGNQMNCTTNNSTGSVYKTPNLESANHYVQFKPLLTDVASPFIAGRLLNAQNLFGLRTDVGASIDVYRRISNSFTLIGTIAGPAYVIGDTLRLECLGSTFTVKKNGVEIPGLTGAIDPALTNQGVGVLARGTIGIWADDFEAGTLNTSFSLTVSMGSVTARAQTGARPTTAQLTASVGTVAVSTGAGAYAFGNKLITSVEPVFVTGEAPVNVSGQQVTVEQGSAIGSIKMFVDVTGLGLSVSTMNVDGLDFVIEHSLEVDGFEMMIDAGQIYSNVWGAIPAQPIEGWIRIEGHA